MGIKFGGLVVICQFFFHMHICIDEEVGHISTPARASIDYNIHPCNPGQPAESAKPVHYNYYTVCVI